MTAAEREEELRQFSVKRLLPLVCVLILLLDLIGLNHPVQAAGEASRQEAAVTAAGGNEPESLRLSQPYAQIRVGQTLDLDAIFSPTDAKLDGSPAFSSDHPEIASVTSDGRVSGLAQGEAKITVTYGALSDTCTVFVAKDDAAAVSGVVSRIEALTEASKTAELVQAQWTFASLTEEQMALLKTEEQDRLQKKVESLIENRISAVLTEGNKQIKAISDMLSSNTWSDSTMLSFVRFCDEIEILRTAILSEEAKTAFDSLEKQLFGLQENIQKAGRSSCGVTMDGDLPWTMRLTAETVTLSQSKVETIASDQYFYKPEILSVIRVRLFDYSDSDQGVKEITSLPKGAVFSFPAGKALPNDGERITLLYGEKRQEIGTDRYDDETKTFTLTEFTPGETLIFVGDWRVPIQDFSLQSEATICLDSADPSVRLEIGGLKPGNTTDTGRAIFKSANPSVATVSADGRVTGLKKGTAVITCEIMGITRSCTVTVRKNALTDFESFWPSLYKNSSNMAVTGAALPKSGENLTEKWIQEDLTSGSRSTLSSPLQIGEKLYVASGKNLFRLNPETGAIEKQTAMSAKTATFSGTAYGDGMIFVSLEGGVIEAFNAETMASLWKSESMGGENMCQLTYHDGYLFAGTWSAGTKENAGRFFCIDTTGKGQTDGNVRKAKWISDDTKGYSRSGAVVVNDAVIFGGDSGVLQSRNVDTGELIDSYATGCRIRSAVACDEKGGCVYFTALESDASGSATGGKVFRVRVNADGSFASKKSAQLPAAAVTTPVIANGRVYVPTGTGASDWEGEMAVLDAQNLETIYTAETPGSSWSAPLVTTAYSGDGEETVYLYMTVNNPDGAVIRMKDDENNRTPQVEVIYRPDGEHRGGVTSSLTCSGDGVIYYHNDRGHLMALTGTNEAVRESSRILYGGISDSFTSYPTSYLTDSYDSSYPFYSDGLTSSLYPDTFWMDDGIPDEEFIDETDPGWDLEDDLMPIAGSLTGGSDLDGMEVMKKAAVIISVIAGIITLIYTLISYYTQSGHVPKTAPAGAGDSPADAAEKTEMTESASESLPESSKVTAKLEPLET